MDDEPTSKSAEGSHEERNMSDDMKASIPDYREEALSILVDEQGHVILSAAQFDAIMKAIHELGAQVAYLESRWFGPRPR